MKNASRVMLSVCFALVHYACTFGVFLITASYASDIDGLHSPLTGFQETLLFSAFYLLLLPFGYLPLGILFNSALLGIGLYFFVDGRAKRKFRK